MKPLTTSHNMCLQACVLFLRSCSTQIEVLGVSWMNTHGILPLYIYTLPGSFWNHLTSAFPNVLFFIFQILTPRLLFPSSFLQALCHPLPCQSPPREDLPPPPADTVAPSTWNMHCGPLVLVGPFFYMTFSTIRFYSLWSRNHVLFILYTKGSGLLDILEVLCEGWTTE